MMLHWRSRVCLWAGLAFANYLLSLAIECQLDSILRFESLPPQLTEDASISKTTSVASLAIQHVRSM